MFLTQIKIVTDQGTKAEREQLSHVAEDYLATLYKNGQIDEDYFYAWCGGKLVAYLHVARADALADRHHSRWGKSSLASIVAAFGCKPRSRILEDDVPRRFRSWKNSRFLFLFTAAFEDESPVRCGDTGAAIPLYLLPLSDQTREYITFWARAYKHHDHVWLASAALEMSAYKQLADPTSELAEDGREFCTEIEERTKKPTYFYLPRYYGREAGEETRPCPLCGDSWRVSPEGSDESQFHKFDFRCDHCRIVSHLAASTEDSRHASIGEYRARRQGKL